MMGNSDKSPTRTPVAESVGDVPVCAGCGLAGELHHDTDICVECWNRREHRIGGGPLRVVTKSMETYHETPLCPAVQNADGWAYWRDEDTMYEDLAGRMDKCVRCHSFDLWGFDHYGTDDQGVIGHA